MRLHRSLAASCAAAGLALCAALPAVAAPASPAPVIHEDFTLLPCPKRPKTTVQIEGCAEHKVVALDKSIDALNAKVFSRLSRSGRAEFVQTNSDWVQYRDEACTTQASIYAGGTIQPIAVADCMVAIDSSHVNELRSMLLALSPVG